MKHELNNIINKLNSAGTMMFFEGASERDILEFERSNNIKLPSELKEWYLYSDGGEFFLPAGLQLYGIKHKPILDTETPDKPNDDYLVIGRLSDGEPVLCKKDSNIISIYNHEKNVISSNETFSSFYEFLDSLPAVLGITES